MEKCTEDAATAEKLENRVAILIHQYATQVSPSLDVCPCLFCALVLMSFSLLDLQVDSLSELFVEWDDVLREAETRIAQLERDKAERESLGYE